MLSLVSSYAGHLPRPLVSSYGSIRAPERPMTRPAKLIEIATISSQKEITCLYDASQGIEVTVPTAQVDSPLLPEVCKPRQLLAMETVCLSPNRPAATTSLHGYNLFRLTALAGMIGTIETLSVYALVKGITTQQASLALIGIYMGYSALAEARILRKTYVSAVDIYNQGTLIKQVAILFCSLLTLQQCNLRRYPVVEADELL